MDLSWGDEVVPNSVTGIHNQSNRGGYVTRLNYEYDGKYLFEFAGRIDGTTFLPAKIVGHSSLQYHLVGECQRSRSLKKNLIGLII